MFYYLEDRVFFTGDFMGGLNKIDGHPIYAEESAWDGTFFISLKIYATKCCSEEGY